MDSNNNSDLNNIAMPTEWIRRKKNSNNNNVQSPQQQQQQQQSNKTANNNITSRNGVTFQASDFTIRNDFFGGGDNNYNNSSEYDHEQQQSHQNYLDYIHSDTNGGETISSHSNFHFTDTTPTKQHSTKHTTPKSTTNNNNNKHVYTTTTTTPTRHQNQAYSFIDLDDISSSSNDNFNNNYNNNNSKIITDVFDKKKMFSMLSPTKTTQGATTGQNYNTPLKSYNNSASNSNYNSIGNNDNNSGESDNFWDNYDEEKRRIQHVKQSPLSNVHMTPNSKQQLQQHLQQNQPTTPQPRKTPLNLFKQHNNPNQYNNIDNSSSSINNNSNYSVKKNLFNNNNTYNTSNSKNNNNYSNNSNKFNTNDIFNSSISSSDDDIVDYNQSQQQQQQKNRKQQQQQNTISNNVYSYSISDDNGMMVGDDDDDIDPTIPVPLFGSSQSPSKNSPSKANVSNKRKETAPVVYYQNEDANNNNNNNDDDDGNDNDSENTQPLTPTQGLPLLTGNNNNNNSNNQQQQQQYLSSQRSLSQLFGLERTSSFKKDKVFFNSILKQSTVPLNNNYNNNDSSSQQQLQIQHSQSNLSQTTTTTGTQPQQQPIVNILTHSNSNSLSVYSQQQALSQSANYNNNNNNQFDGFSQLQQQLRQKSKDIIRSSSQISFDWNQDNEEPEDITSSLDATDQLAPQYPPPQSIAHNYFDTQSISDPITSKPSPPPPKFEETYTRTKFLNNLRNTLDVSTKKDIEEIDDDDNNEQDSILDESFDHNNNNDGEEEDKLVDGPMNDKDLQHNQTPHSNQQQQQQHARWRQFEGVADLQFDQSNQGGLTDELAGQATTQHRADYKAWNAIYFCTSEYTSDSTDCWPARR
ncbi:hypothetical protein PPL_10407 [Heterostelium album PN500]|uniref:Uncharacterized protein n=1 Tax=Heterostelium pallidum (strain ATCC 26659 / Pp 5 / PN500) TaxID=670386 RepID=D3BR04_HETP5|nr:hypothetical protein PPL_10407 [Heterostelium album PN500]EFA76190.1 hypothetical protein PPL_10407 [Heterostelium album PN500]|eukprot:XP_020428323.1 hypothetical protein PPL_10407 [Heterostelium album PN500]